MKGLFYTILLTVVVVLAYIFLPLTGGKFQTCMLFVGLASGAWGFGMMSAQRYGFYM